MMKTILILGSILALGLAEVLELDNGQFVDVDFGNTQPDQSIIIPYPYQSNHQTHPVVVQPPVVVQSPVVVQPSTPNTEGTIVVPVQTVVTEVAPAGFISTAVYKTLCAAKAALSYIITKAPALVAGTAVALAVCKFTCLCDSQASISEAQSQIVSIATPERIARAAEFVTSAVEKYNKMQKK